MSKKTIEWYFPIENTPGNQRVDEFSDSKFSIDKWDSFTRELIQNSLDAHNDSDNKNEPVKVIFSNKLISKNKIPGANRLHEVINLCLRETLNPQTKEMLENATAILSNDEIMCLKISDYNTTGVNPDLNDAWGALVYDEGVSKKQRPGSAGSHGVGKKAPFIISGCRNVFYSSRYKDGSYTFQGKTSLVNFNENEQCFSPRGWFGFVDKDTKDRRKKILPLNNSELLKDYDNFFDKRSENGCDVIIIGVNITNQDEIKKIIIRSVLENFFVGVYEEKLEVEVFGIRIDKNSILDIISKYYDYQRRSIQRHNDNNISYNLEEYFSVYLDGNPTRYDLTVDGKTYGYLELYFKKENRKGKKYYCVFRDHGMKIHDQIMQTDQPFTAVAILRDNEELPPDKTANALFSSRENSAHNQFVIDDEQIKCDELTKKLIEKFYELIEKHIRDNTEIKVSDDMPLEGLADMISIQGYARRGQVSLSKPRIKKRKRKTYSEKGLGDKTEDYGDGVTGGGGGKKKPQTPGEHVPVKPGDSINATLFKKYSIDPYFQKSNNQYRLSFTTLEDLKNCSIKIYALSVDGKINYVENMIKSASIDGRVLSVDDNVIKGVECSANKKMVINIELYDLYDYTLEAQIFIGGTHNA